jgi:hypothetical protein
MDINLLHDRLESAKAILQQNEGMLANHVTSVGKLKEVVDGLSQKFFEEQHQDQQKFVEKQHQDQQKFIGAVGSIIETAQSDTERLVNQELKKIVSTGILFVISYYCIHNF